ncbi:hopanoid-associated sugar epimerase [Calothrix sp. PCC 6303]|uniref:hopanoid-associated sugar epimerase n=1 Tax=Calothrix sp. PCC 6303 TaxID=1170562 RepID=UPI0002A05983|nr:hopanoid-associated sugar epimerase [Calothrix sp. PCC 6303]AFZ04037.1 hopanoid-associated sugar epimerase [Calothrix sp. PCC 6303]
MSKVFITGGTGFIGANLTQLLLQQGYQIKALVRPQSQLDNLKNLDIELVEGDLNDPDIYLQLQGCQYLFHVAAHYSLWQKDRTELYQNNVSGTENILAAAKKAGIERTVYTSSVAAIGINKNSKTTNETYQSPITELVGHYKKSKYLAEQKALEAAKCQEIVIVNPSSPIGAGDIKPTPTGDIILRFLRRQMPVYIDTGLNFIDVRDVAMGHLLALQKGKSGERYILAHQNLSLKQFLDQLAEITGIPAPQQSIPAWIPFSVAWIDEKILANLGKKPSVPLDGVRMAKQSMYYDPSKAINELGLPQTPLDNGMKAAINWFRIHGYV